MVIIFAGCDCSGKSTCFNKMDKSSGRFEKGVATENLEFAIANLKTDVLFNLFVVYDRHPIIDDIVYSQVFSHKESKLVSKIEDLSALLSHCCVIYFDCDNNIIANRMKERGDEYVTESQIPEIKDEYEKAFKLLKLNPHRVDTSNANPDEVYKQVMEVIEYERRNKEH